jgi:hypothetical protein
MRLLFPSLFLAIALSLPVASVAQNHPGSDDAPILTPREAHLLDSLLPEHPGPAALAGKRYAFVTGSTGHVLEPKSVFFQRHVLPWTTIGKQPVVAWQPFTEPERRASGGYDGLILVWVKYLGPKQRNTLMRELNVETSETVVAVAEPGFVEGRCKARSCFSIKR